ncbi:MAG TPA: tetratricopeptide repeat protein [Oscillospiraceae bacterium]|nr:tetratricopeptide repeat protein [Oscillospiraceae bacterium]HPF56759.1 tetratricopeptide repeat protein [Clostridiales bacterium]HPK34243.1 tetratricopeptide repeat protein [Oscillospiraceae bacterium]HPR74854.1 tetratricopeptide repeat protein [Oscillospiraceae bacterium]
MSLHSITHEDVAELLKKIIIARTQATEEKNDETLTQLAKKQAETAEAYLLTDDIEQSRHYFTYSSETLEQISDLCVKVDFYERIGKAFTRAGKFSDASGYFLKAVTAYETVPQDTPERRNELALLYKFCASAMLKTRHIDDAVALLTKRRDMLKNAYKEAVILSDLLGWADALYDLGSAYSHYEAFDAALKLYDEAISLYNTAERDFKADSRREIANCLISIGGIYELNKDYQSALEQFEKALEINRRLAIRDGDESSLKHLSASCTHTAELYEMMERLVDALALFREKADVNLRLSKLKPVIEAPEILFLVPSENFAQRLERLESKLPWYSLLFEMDNPGHDKLYITYYTMGRFTEELARKNNRPELYDESLKLFEASESILNTLTEEFSDLKLDAQLREIKSAVKRIHSYINQKGEFEE